MSYKCNTCNTMRKIPAPPIFELDAQPQSEQSVPQDDSPQLKVIQDNFHNPAGPSHDPMELDELNTTTQPPESQPRTQSQSQSQSEGRAKRTTRSTRRMMPRTPPLFERNVGHIIIRGTHMISDQEQLGPVFASNIGSASAVE